MNYLFLSSVLSQGLSVSSPQNLINYVSNIQYSSYVVLYPGYIGYMLNVIISCGLCRGWNLQQHQQVCLTAFTISFHFTNCNNQSNYIITSPSWRYLVIGYIEDWLNRTSLCAPLVTCLLFSPCFTKLYCSSPYWQHPSLRLSCAHCFTPHWLKHVCGFTALSCNSFWMLDKFRVSTACQNMHVHRWAAIYSHHLCIWQMFLSKVIYTNWINFQAIAQLFSPFIL